MISSDFETALNSIGLIKPNFYFKDQEYLNGDLTGNIKKEIKEVKKNGGKIVFTRLKKYSSSNLINSENISNKDNSNNSKFFSKLDKSSTLSNILNSNLKPLVIGEAIIDKYIFTSGLGKSGKESILTVAKNNEKEFFGGSLAIAKNFLDFSNKIGLVFDFGEDKKKLKIIRKKLDKKIKLFPILKKNCQFNSKTKLVDSATKNKILGIYDINDRPISKVEEKKLINVVKKNVKDYDFIVICDYDHGLINNNIFKNFLKFKKPIIATSQLNSSNIAYHDLLKLNGCDLLIINSNELRSFYKRNRNVNNNTISLSKNFIKNTKFKNLIVTVGKDGAYFFNKKKYFYFPALSKDEKGDKIGSGDTFLVCAALSFIKKLDPLTTLFLGSLSAKQNLNSFANENKLSKKIILNEINTTLR